LHTVVDRATLTVGAIFRLTGYRRILFSRRPRTLERRFATPVMAVRCAIDVGFDLIVRSRICHLCHTCGEHVGSRRDAQDSLGGLEETRWSRGRMAEKEVGSFWRKLGQDANCANAGPRAARGDRADIELHNVYRYDFTNFNDQCTQIAVSLHLCKMPLSAHQATAVGHPSTHPHELLTACRPR